MRCLSRLIVFGILFGAAFYAVISVLDPWALHIGDRPTPLLYWQGVGTLIAKDGKAYPLYVYFYPANGASRLRRRGLRANSGLHGMGDICTAPGASQTLKLTGSIYGGYKTTDGSLMDFRMLEWKVIDPTNSKGYFDLAGGWQGRELVMDWPDEEGRKFLSGVQIDGAKVTLHWAERSEFEAACRSMTIKNAK